MKFPKLFLLSAVLAVGALSTTSSLTAQTMAPTPGMSTDAGLIGKRHVGLSITDETFNAVNLHSALGGGVLVNIPLSPNVDGRLAYDYKRASDASFGMKENAVSGTVLVYNTMEYGKAYISGTVSQTWDKQKTFGITQAHNDLGVGVAVGCEYRIASMSALDGSISYGDTFSGTGNKSLRYKMEFNHWCSPTTALVASAAYNQVKNAADSKVFSLGLRRVF